MLDLNFNAGKNRFVPNKLLNHIENCVSEMYDKKKRNITGRMNLHLCPDVYESQNP